MAKQSKKCFEMGQLVNTPGVLATFTFQEVINCLARHQVGDWGDVHPEDRLGNERSLKLGNRLISVYRFAPCDVWKEGRVLWCITEADRSVTVALLPEEY